MYLLTRGYYFARPLRTVQYRTTWLAARSRGLVACPGCSPHLMLDPENPHSLRYRRR